MTRAALRGALACIALIAGSAFGQGARVSAEPTRIALTNPGFESLAPGMLGNPQGWFSIQHAGDLSYTFRLDATQAHGGARSVRVDNVGPEPFGAIYQQVEAIAQRGRRVRFSAWLRTEDARGSFTGGGAVLMLQAMQSGAPLAWNHMKESPVGGTTAWTRYAIELDVPAAADRLEVGAMLHGPGRLWLDDAELVMLPR
jgi:hypothetical protein